MYYEKRSATYMLVNTINYYNIFTIVEVLILKRSKQNIILEPTTTKNKCIVKNEVLHP